MKNVFFYLLSLLLIGCGGGYDENAHVKVLDKKIQNNTHVKSSINTKKTATPHIKTPKAAPVIAKNDNRLKLKELTLKTKIELAKIEANSKKALLEIQTKENIEAKKVDKEIAFAKQTHALKQQEEQYAFYKIALWITAALIIFILLFLLYNNKKKREAKQQLQEENFKNEKEMKYLDAYNARVNKMLDIVSGKDVPEKTSKELIGLLKDISQKAPMLELKSDKKKRFF